MIGSTLALYFARRFATTVLGIFVFFFSLIFIITYVEFFTRTVKDADFDGMQVLLMSFYRVPNTSEDALPFIVLFGSIAAFVTANRRLEVVIVRAAGVSAWQFLLPACIVGFIIGVVATAVYNPISTTMRAWSDEIAANLLESPPSDTAESGPMWLRQTADGRESIIGATRSSNQGMKIAGVSAFVFDENGDFQERIDAPSGAYVDGAWRLDDATITAPSEDPRRESIYELSTALSPAQVREAFDETNSTSFWELKGLIETAHNAGIPATRFVLRYNSLLSRPVMLLAMVLIAAIVSLRFSRSRQIGGMILAGVAVGFMLYVVSKIAGDLGSGGVVPPLIAAWLPAGVMILVGATVLLHLEDG